MNKDNIETRIKLNPLSIIFTNLFLPILLMYHKSWAIHLWLLLVTSSLLLAHAKWRLWLKLFAVYLTFSAIYFVCIIIKQPMSIMLASVFMALLQFYPCFILAAALISNYKSNELMSALQKLHLPRALIIAVTITLRYLPTFKAEFAVIKTAMALRGIKASIWQPIKSFGYFISPQLFRCLALADEITAAGLVKGIDAKVARSSYYANHFTWLDLLYACALALSLLLVKLGGA